MINISKNYLRAFAVFSAFVLAACTPKQLDPAITLAEGQKTELTVSSSSSSETISFNSATSWTATSSESWITLSPASGDGGDVTVTAAIASNTLKEDRKCTIKITSGPVSKEISITQSAKSAIDVDGNSVKMSYEGGDFKVVVGHNVDLKISLSQTWVSQVTTKSYVTDSLTFRVEANPTHAARNAYVTIASKDGKTTTSISVKQDASPYTKVKEIAALSADTEVSFMLNASDVRVSRKIGNYVHLEDTTGAVLYYPDKVAESAILALSEGSSVTGIITGKIKKKNSIPQITSLDISSALVSSGTQLPETTITIAALLNDFDKYISCRLNIKDLTIVKGTAAGTSATRTGQVSQSGSSMYVYAVYTPEPAELMTGLKGELICFPAYNGTNKMLNVYSTDDFLEVTQPAEETAFTNLTAIGIYNISNSTSPAEIYKSKDNDQICTMTYSSSTLFNMCSLSGSYAIMNTIGAKKLSNGMTTTVVTSKMGSNASISSVQEGTYNVVVAKKTNKQAWLRTTDSTIGFIISLE